MGCSANTSSTSNAALSAMRLAPRSALFLLGRHISGYLGQRGLRTLKKLMGLLLNLVAVNMILVGVRTFLSVGH